MTAPNQLESERKFMEQVLRAEAGAVASLADRLGIDASRAVDHICACADAGGSVLVAGLGKSGLIGKKISATLASLGVPSHDIHPAEAAHGDLGRIRTTDLLIALSNSGETEEVVTLAALLKQDGVPVISITGGDGRNALSRLSTVALTLGVIVEGGDLGLAPTCSTTATLALGDALALAAARRRSFTADDFAKRHPGGLLGGLLRPVTECLRFTAGHNLPLVQGDKRVRDALDEAQQLGRRPGAVIVINAQGALDGIFTDGDLRRLVLKDPAGLDRPIAHVMTRQPRTLLDSALVRDAVRMFREHRQDEIPVVDSAGRPVGLLDVQDLIAMKVVQA